MEYDNFEDAVQYNNNVAHGLSSSLFSKDLTHIYEWIGASGSDCGIGM